MYTEYTSVLADSGSKLSAVAATGNSASFMVGRLSYTFGLAGPCVSTDTACSSSLVAAHLGHRSILTEDATAAVAGGANLMLSSTTTVAICQLQALSPVGRCKTFDASADGYGRGEGFAVVILAPEVPQVQSLAILKATAVNQDGRSSSLTAPNGPSQTALVSHALRHASLQSSELSYIALHGTGTPLGDPIEVNALGQALTGNVGAPRPVSLGSIKSCFGHTEGAAGLTGLFLAIAAAHSTISAPIMHLHSTNTYVEGALGDWKSEHRLAAAVPRQASSGANLSGALAGTSSFGMSGVNAHAIVSSSANVGLGIVKPASLQTTRLWPLPVFSTLLARVAIPTTTSDALFECHLQQANLAYIWEQSVAGKPTLSFAAVLELAAAGIVAKSSGQIPAVLNATAIGSIQVTQAVMLQCILELGSGAITLKNAAGTLGTALLGNVSAMVMGSNKPIAYSRAGLFLLPCNKVSNASFLNCTASVAPGNAASCERGGVLQQSQASMTLATLSNAESDGGVAALVLGCSAYVPESSPSNTSSPMNRQAYVSSSRSTVAFGTTLSSTTIDGLVSKSVHALRRERILNSPNSAAWQLVWQPFKVPSGSMEDKEEVPRWLLVSTVPVALSQLCTPAENARLHAMNACWTSSDAQSLLDEAHFSSLEINVSSDVHVEWLMRCSRSNYCLFTETSNTTNGSINGSKANTNGILDKHQMETSVEAMLATYQAILRNPRPSLKVSLITFDAQEVPPFSVSHSQPTASVLQGIARTLFMEARSTFGASIDLSSNSNLTSNSAGISSTALCHLLNIPGEFAVRGGRVYSLRLMRGSVPRHRQVPTVRSAFVAGGTKVS